MAKNRLRTRLASTVRISQGGLWCGGTFCKTAITLNFPYLLYLAAGRHQVISSRSLRSAQSPQAGPQFGFAVNRASVRHSALRPSLSCFNATMTVNYE